MTEESPLHPISIRSRMLARTGLYRDIAARLAEEAGAVAELVTSTLLRGGTLFFCGNGGSAADAQHLAAEYVVRLGTDRRALAALALTVDSSVLTAGANDYGFEHVFARQVEALGRKGDILFLHSTSGESENLALAADAARDRGMLTVALLAGDGGRLRSRVDHALVVPTDDGPFAQEAHLALGHEICAHVERSVASPRGTPGAKAEPMGPG
jgi:D-sedoheptulose 7-phosphate isomerase